MIRSHKVLGFLFVALFGIYGCAKNPSSPGDNRMAEAKVQRLEEDFRAAAAARDSFRQRLVQAEERQAEIQRQLERTTVAIAAEKTQRETAQADLRARTTERDARQTQYDGFRRTIRDLVGQADAAMANPPTPALAGDAPANSPTAARN